MGNCLDSCLNSQGLRRFSNEISIESNNTMGRRGTTPAASPSIHGYHTRSKSRTAQLSTSSNNIDTNTTYKQKDEESYNKSTITRQPKMTKSSNISYDNETRQNNNIRKTATYKGEEELPEASANIDLSQNSSNSGRKEETSFKSTKKRGAKNSSAPIMQANTSKRMRLEKPDAKETESTSFEKSGGEDLKSTDSLFLSAAANSKTIENNEKCRISDHELKVVETLNAILDKAKPFIGEIEKFEGQEHNNKHYYIEESLRRLVEKLDDMYDDIGENDYLRGKRKDVYKFIFPLFDRLDEKVLENKKKLEQEKQ